MPRNGSGTYTLPQAAFVPSTVISSTAVNSDFSDIATAITGSVAADGQTTISGALKGSSGSVGSPSYSFSADLDCGMYRIGANNIGLSVNGTKILDIATTGLSVTGTLAVSGAQTFTGPASFPAGFLAGDGTVSLPAWSFTSDTDSGVYRIGANNIGVGVNGAKVLDIGTTGLNVVGSVSSNGTALVPMPQSAGMINGTIVESHAGNAVTFALKTLSGGDPSATDIVYFAFRDVTAATGDYVVLQVTAALSLTISSGSTLGTFSSNVPFKLWLVAFNDSSTVRLGVINTVLGGDAPSSVYPLSQFAIATTIAEGGAGGADNAQVFYTPTTVTSKAYVPVAYASYQSGVATAGAWAVSPTRLQLFGPSVPLPGAIIQTIFSQTGASATGTTVVPGDDTIPQNNEGDQYMSISGVPTSTTNLWEIRAQGLFASSAGAAADYMAMSLYQDVAANALTTVMGSITSANAAVTLTLKWLMLSRTASSTTFNIRAGQAQAGTTTFNGASGGRLYGGVANSYIEIIEVAT